ncbi:MAG: chondroitinase family polysaccharide lyase [Gemmatimonadota bacterium]|nr:chondroitinase family polysaccharide lyase [Gemmatimonadota bacterium]
MAQNTPWHYSFEETTLSAAYRADAGSQVSLSTRRYKGGAQSLKWAWQNNGRIVFTDPAPGRSEVLIGFRAWVYNEEALDEVLTFGFGTESELSANNPRYQFEFGLNFTGWRAMWIHLREDARNNSYTGPRNGRVTAFEIRAPNSGAVYLDLMELVERIDSRRSPDAQVPFVNGGANTSGDKTREYRWSLNRLPGPLPSQITDDERRAFETIARRYEAWVLGDGVKNDQREPVRIRLNELTAYIRRGHSNLANYEIRRENDLILGKPLFAARSSYRPYFQSVFQNVLLRLVLDYRLNGNEEAKDRVIDVFDYLHDQGWADGSGVGAMHHEFLRIASYAHAVYLMRDILEDTERLERELASLKWYSMFGELYEQTWDPGTNADFLRSVAMYRLLCILMMDDSPEKVANMRRYVVWLNNALDIAPGWLDTIKPDYTGFHHRGIYANAYAPNAFHVASVLVYLLHDTPFAVADDKRDNLKQALLTSRIMANTYDISMAVNGRFPRNTAVATKLLPAYMYVALSYSPVDAELSGAFMQLWKPESQLLIEDLFERVSVRLMYLHTPGAMQMMADFASAGYASATPPSGHWTLPYGALSIHRREDWMVSMKGWGKYVWDYESSGRNNPLGRYLSYGTMLIYANGDPVGREASGIVRDGWDWSMWPGTTVIRLSHEQLKHEGRDRNFSDETFVGGVNIEGQNGVFALKLHDTRFNTSFRAVKTVFCFDDVLVCLGSGIENDDGGHTTVTPLFQAAISEDRSTGVNGESVRGIPYVFSGVKGHGVWLMDSLGNGYVIPDGGELRVQRQVQTPGDFGDDSGGTGAFELAYLDHGSAPQGASYHYAVLVQRSPDGVRAFASAPEYDVWQRDGQAHIVHHRGMKMTGYALFDKDTRPTGGPVESVSLPSLVMSREVDDGLLLSVADPDFGWRWEIQTPHRQDGSLIVNQPSEPRKVEVIVRGKWRLDQSYDLVEIVEESEDQTVVAFICQDGKSVEVKLVRPGIGVANLDFDGDGAVGFTDFLLFSSKFGLSEGDAGFEAQYDLDGNGMVGFSDFLIFVQGFGKPVSGKPVALRNGGERLGS